MLFWRLAAVGSLLLAVPVCAHEVAGKNGGRVTDAGKYHVELVARDKTVDVYVTDEGEKPLPATGFKGTAILVINGKPARITLIPTDDKKLTGTAEVALGSAPKGAVQLTAPDGATASGKFN
ncbi:hypothetical protein [Methylobacterium isbiliense]|uniref:Uncharacterized protein n=1 Tax=Methylobacterium isbiliense TaxID=315478 RepID=A0ABQ4SQ51_9HYPH|nr:hypothetical protein [Methylobacterium isbiliense]MDN3625955.1 hypothetical protein [Methylobacterium isbiliense]GJE04624.1 hypothetical protein GMJLKIPL_6588 [Methylobacterium isbiliense]